MPIRARTRTDHAARLARAKRISPPSLPPSEWLTDILLPLKPR